MHPVDRGPAGVGAGPREYVARLHGPSVREQVGPVQGPLDLVQLTGSGLVVVLHKESADADFLEDIELIIKTFSKKFGLFNT